MAQSHFTTERENGLCWPNNHAESIPEEQKTKRTGKESDRIRSATLTTNFAFQEWAKHLCLQNISKMLLLHEKGEMKAEFKQCRKGNILEAHFKTTLSHDIVPLRFEATYLSQSLEKSLCGLMQVGKEIVWFKNLLNTTPKLSGSRGKADPEPHKALEECLGHQHSLTEEQPRYRKVIKSCIKLLWVESTLTSPFHKHSGSGEWCTVPRPSGTQVGS